MVLLWGAVCLSVHGKYRIAGDNTMFAMPETGIGYFPDVGGTYFLPRLGLDIGQWLGLTGARLNAGQSLEIGVANGFIPSDKHADFTKALGDAALDGTDEAVQDVLNVFQEAGPMDADMPAALSAFSEKDVPSILKALDGMGDEWAEKQVNSLRRKSPLALSVTFEAIKRGLDLEFKSAMTQELDLSLNFLKTQDFYEGIRAQLIDKDRNPKWSHESVELVTSDQIERVFRQTANPRQEFLS